VLIFLVNHTKTEAKALASLASEPEPEYKDTLINIKARKHLLTVKGNKNLLLDIDDIAYVLLENDISKAYTFQGTSTLIGDPLETIMNQLPPTFYRANRQSIIHLKAIKGFKAERSGKLILDVQPVPPAPITVSQKQSVAFKQWLMEN
jgi:DNA-binding LytR/AlgR family response regulator